MRRECETADGLVINGARTLSFGELAEEAADRSPPSRPALRQSGGSRLIGQPLARLDGPAKTDGSMRFAGDVRLPGMLFASARMAPPGGRLTGFSREAIAKVQGVRHIAARDGWFAVVADNWWAAEQAVKAANPRFTGLRSPSDPRPLFEDALASGSTDRSFDRGDYRKTVRGSRPLAATYWAEPSLHLGLEPLTATARVSGDQVEVWAPTQAPDLAARSAGAMLYPMPVGEPAGRALESDAIPIAVELARALKAPVQVTLPQSAGQNHDRGSPGALARMTALPGQGGITAAWQMRVATGDGLGSAIARLTASEPGELGEAALDGAEPPYSIPDVRVETVAVPAAANAGYMRGSPQREYCFFTESFVDELAHAAGLEPLAFRMSQLGGNPRLARCLQAAAQLAQWDGGGRGSNMGIAACSAYGSHIALVATATIGDDQRIKVHRLSATVDCGRIVNSGLVTQQVAGGLVWAMAQATVPAAEWAAGMPRARPLGRSACRESATRPRSRSSCSRATSRPAASAGSARPSSPQQSPTRSTPPPAQAPRAAVRPDGGRMSRPADHPPMPREQVGVLLINLGTPDAPEERAVRRYLAEFLSDPRVIEIPGIAWKPILHGIILRTRPKKSAEAYNQIWTNEGSPLRVIAHRQAVGAAQAAARRQRSLCNALRSSRHRRRDRSNDRRGLHAHSRCAALPAILRRDDCDCERRGVRRSGSPALAAGGAHAAALL